MFISKLNLNKDSLTVQRAVMKDVESLHSIVWKAFPYCDPRPKMIFSQNGATIIAISSVKPLINPDSNIFIGIETKPFNPKIQSHYSFRVSACPVHKFGSNHNGPKRVAILDKIKQEEWLKNQGKRCGFKVLRVEVGNYEWVKAKKFSFIKVPFSGALQVTDPDKFKEMLETGIGVEKAYGLGMMQAFAA